MALNKQIHIYSVDTSAFYNVKEKKLHKRMNKFYIYRNYLKKLLNKKTLADYEIEDYHIRLTKINQKIKLYKDSLCELFKEENSIRILDNNYLKPYNVVSVFDSTLTRTMNIPIDSLNEDLMIVQTYFFDVIEDIILDGFLYNNEKYICLTASAGQIRTKKTVFIKEGILQKIQMSLMCGLTIKDINAKGGVNINKFLAYLALCSSATDAWNKFDIDKCIVVDDFETMVEGVVDFIDDETYEIVRKKMFVPINHTDGAGMVLPKLSDKNLMIRLPWVKGLLGVFEFDKILEELKCSTKVKDIYGKTWDIIKDDIQIIFTKSQFKMYKYYSSWDDYKNKFKIHNCMAGICNVEEDVFSDAKINYQMLQTLVDITDEALENIAKKTKNDIYRIGNDRKTMLKVLGVTKSNINKNYYQQALEIYPQLLCDTYSKQILKQTKKSMVKQARAGKLEINGKYTFILPDLYAFCENLFLNKKEPNGLLKNGEVFCKLYNKKDKLACLRSPHLFREWAIKQNIIDDIKSKWFITNAVYTSCHDLISKTLQFDVDGDKSLVCADETLISVAEEHMKDIVPLYYNMKKAEAQIITNRAIFEGLKSAYTGGNIGIYSNDISKLWNSEEIKSDKYKILKIIKLLCMENNFTIDYAKTLYKPERPVHIKKLITSYTKYKTPHFFVYAKDKEKDKVEFINESPVNRLEKIIKNSRINFETKDIGEFNYKMLMNDKEIAKDEKIIKKYTELDLKNRFIDIEPKEDETSDTIYIYKNIRNKILEVNDNINYVVDVLVEYLYGQKQSSYKTTLWSSFGDIIIKNLKNNITTGQIYCESCGDLIEQTNNKIKNCKYCAIEINKIKTRERMSKIRKCLK